MDYPSIARTELSEFPLLYRGKVRDIYIIDDKTLLIVTTDRMSAFDVVLDEPVPGKGVILNRLSLFWMNRFAGLIPNHVVESDVNRYPAVLQPYHDILAGRSLLARKTEPLPVECIVRGYLTGSSWQSYRETGTVCGRKLPDNLPESAKLPYPVFTPSTKASVGEHDQNISLADEEALLGKETARKLEELSLAMYTQASAYAAERGIIIADTKFEFGKACDQIILIDEVLTPDSSRFWPADTYAPGQSQPSFDKQHLRDWLEERPWDKKPPPPALPQKLIDVTAQKYREAFRILTGAEL